MNLAEQKILVTGSSGFLGEPLLRRLRAAGCKWLFTPRSSEYDLRQSADVERLYRDLRPQVVFHLAAVVGGIEANRLNPGRFFYENAIMGIQMMEFARRAGVEKYIALGTICAYPKHTPPPFREDDLWSGYPEETNAPYGLAKKMQLVQSQAYRQQYGFDSIYILPVNLYGPRDNFDLGTSHVIPAMIRKYAEAMERGENQVVFWGDGSPTREFLYVEDAAQGLALAAERYDGPLPVNLGSGQEIAIRELAQLIAEETGFAGEIRWDTSKPNGQPRRCLEVSRARELFGFQASTPLREGLRRTIAWFRENRQALREIRYDHA